MTAPPAVQPGELHVLDWRFLCRQGLVAARGRVLLAPGGPVTARVLLAAGAQRVAAADDDAPPGGYDAAVCGWPVPAGLTGRLQPGGVLVVAVDGRAGRLAVVARALHAQGLEVLATAAALPHVSRPHALVDPAEPVAAAAALRRVPSGRAARVAGAVAAVLVRLGAGSLVLRSGWVVARVPREAS